MILFWIDILDTLTFILNNINFLKILEFMNIAKLSLYIHSSKDQMMQKRTITLSSLTGIVLMVPTLVMAMPANDNASASVISDNVATAEPTTPVDSSLQEEGVNSNNETVAIQSAEVENVEMTVTPTPETANIPQDITGEPSAVAQVRAAKLEPLQESAPIEDQQQSDTSDQASLASEVDAESGDDSAINTPITLQETRKIIAP